MILLSQEFTAQLKDSLCSAQDSLIITSAFIKEGALSELSNSFHPDNTSISIIARWQKHDLLAGASDLAIYKRCKENGWRFGVDQNLHGKLYLIDEREIYLGSANLTHRGLNLAGYGNHEFGTRIPAADADLTKIHNFIEDEVTWMTDELYEKISSEVDESKEESQPISASTWSDDINDLLFTPVEYLWVQELAFNTPQELLQLDLNDESVIHDFELLSLDFDEICEASLKRKFKQSRLFKWLHSLLKEQGDIRFGGVSTHLHNALLDDPKPYRVKVKSYNQVIFAWAEFIDDVFEVYQPNYTQVLTLK